MPRQGWDLAKPPGRARRFGLSLRLAWFGVLDRERRARQGSDSVNSTGPIATRDLARRRRARRDARRRLRGCGPRPGQARCPLHRDLGRAAGRPRPWLIDIADDHFTATASGSTAGLIQVFTSGQGQSAARGVAGEKLIPSTYVSSIATDRKHDECAW